MVAVDPGMPLSQALAQERRQHDFWKMHHCLRYQVSKFRPIECLRANRIAWYYHAQCSMILRSLHKKAPPLQKLTAETPGTQRFPSIARCVCCAAVVT
jgi:hypothetical protein